MLNTKSLVACLIAAVSLSAGGAFAKPPPAAGAKSPDAVHARASPAAKPHVVAIDAGHGGKDTGAIGARGALEKDVVYAIARKLAGLVREQPGLRAVMVRKGDTFVGLARRAEIARRAGADLFISIHADAHPDDAARGSAVFILSPRRLEAAGYAEDVLEASGLAAGKILGELRKRQHLHYAHVQKARFMVLKSPDVPSMLIETGFVSNPEEEKHLASPAYQERVARAIFNGIRAYFRAAEPLRVKTAGARVVLADRQ
jgi:N-acetylmuramoyl-L-alanine amidase